MRTFAGGWQNSILLRGGAAGAVAGLKARPHGDLGIIGSASLVRGLHAAGLIDRYTLLICPLTLGSGTGCSKARPPDRVRAHQQRHNHQGCHHRVVHPPVRTDTPQTLPSINQNRLRAQGLAARYG